MRRAIGLTAVLLLLLAVFGVSMGEDATKAPTSEEAAETPATTPETGVLTWDLMDEGGRLTGIIICIDPGHQAMGNYDLEPIAPGSSFTKTKTSSGTQGVKSGVPEYEVNLEVSLMLRDALEAEGATVVMTRESNNVDISNIERALIANGAEADLFLRIHCNGSEDSSVNGIGLYVRDTGTLAQESYDAADCLLPAMADATGAKANGIYKRDTYTGLNWAQVPAILVEMGYMSNADEDLKLVDYDYQELLVKGIVEGVCDYFGKTE
jgi:N-acetylmuramoyl-L-alanine amidase